MMVEIFKFKGQMPKPPLSAYMLFSTSMGSKFRERFPGQTQRELATEIGVSEGCGYNHSLLPLLAFPPPGKAWGALTAAKQQRYRDEYLALRSEYETKVATFFEDHPEAKPLRVRSGQRSRPFPPALVCCVCVDAERT